MFFLWNMFRHPSCHRHENPAALAFRGPREGEKKELRNRRAAQLDCSSWMVYCQKPNLSVETGQILRAKSHKKIIIGCFKRFNAHVCILPIYIYIHNNIYIYTNMMPWPTSRAEVLSNIQTSFINALAMGNWKTTMCSRRLGMMGIHLTEKHLDNH